MAAGKGNHAIAPARDQQGLQFHPRHNLLGGGTQELPILTDTDAESLFQFGLIGSGGGDTGKLQHAKA